MKIAARVAVGSVVVVCVVAGVGWLYLLRDVGVLDVGPRVGGALPLQQLASGEAQPLLRMALAWLPVGIVAGLALRAAGMRSRVFRAAAAAAVSSVVLLLAGAVSDAIADSSSIGGHIGAQFQRPGIWVAAGLLVIGSLLVGGPRELRAHGRREGRWGRRAAPTGP